MHPLVFRMLLVFVIIFVLNILRQFIIRRERINRIELPAKIQRIGYRVIVILTFLMGSMALLGFVMRDMEMAIVSMVMTLIFGTLSFFIRRKFKRYYEETSESFLLIGEYEVIEVYYDNIVDWIPLSKQIGVRDKTQFENRYICVNFNFSDPEILLTKLAEMTLSGKFEQAETDVSRNQNRKEELIKHLRKNGYDDLAESILEQ